MADALRAPGAHLDWGAPARLTDYTGRHWAAGVDHTREVSAYALGLAQGRTRWVGAHRCPVQTTAWAIVRATLALALLALLTTALAWGTS